MSTRLELRIARLEEQMGVTKEPLVVRITDYSNYDGAIIGFACNGFDVLRQPGESEEDCYSRAIASSPRPRGQLITLYELREDKPLMEREQQENTAVAVRPDPVGPKSINPAPRKAEPKREVRVLTVKEAEDLYSDRPHWMAI